MAQHDKFKSLTDLVIAELTRMVAATEPALREAVTGEDSEVSEDERWTVVADFFSGLSELLIQIAQAVDVLADRQEGPGES